MCPICTLPIIEFGVGRATQIGNTLFHNSCLIQKRTEALAQGKIITFIWRGEQCTHVKLTEKEYKSL